MPAIPLPPLETLALSPQLSIVFVGPVIGVGRWSGSLQHIQRGKLSPRPHPTPLRNDLAPPLFACLAHLQALRCRILCHTREKKGFLSWAFFLIVT